MIRYCRHPVMRSELRYTVTSDGSVLAWPRASAPHGAKPYDAEDPYDEIGGEA